VNKHSGVLGLAGLGTGDMRDLEIAAEKGNERAVLARKIYAYRVRKYIGAYMAVLGGLDILVFTGGVGENDFDIREKILENMGGFGLVLDIEQNKTRDQRVISSGPIRSSLSRRTRNSSSPGKPGESSKRYSAGSPVTVCWIYGPISSDCRWILRVRTTLLQIHTAS